MAFTINYGEVSILEAVFIQEEESILLDVVSDAIEIKEAPDHGSVIMEDDSIEAHVYTDEIKILSEDVFIIPCPTPLISVSFDKLY